VCVWCERLAVHRRLAGEECASACAVFVTLPRSIALCCWLSSRLHSRFAVACIVALQSLVCSVAVAGSGSCVAQSPLNSGALAFVYTIGAAGIAHC
jgi:hypothetical protein